MEIVLHGIGVSPGIAIGPALTFGVTALDVPKYSITNVKKEQRRFEEAVDELRTEWQRLHERTRETLGEQHAEIFKTQLMALDDPTMREDIARGIEEQKANAEHLVQEWFGRHAKLLEASDVPLFRERAADLVDVGRKLVSKLLKADLESLEKLEKPSVIVAHDLSPSDAAKLDVKNTLGIVTDASGPTSHTAILARAYEIPAVVGLRFVGSYALPGDMIVVDGTKGDVLIRPDTETLSRYRIRGEREARGRRALLAAEIKPSSTVDGVAIPTLANIELPIELAHSKRVHAQGIGLYRTEYLYLNRSTLPTEEEQYEAYAEAAQAMAPWPVTLRTLDVGGDKLVSHLQLGDETNPQLGWRAVRFCLERRDIFEAQLRAMFRASVHGNVQIMFPLISGLEELRRVKEIVREVCAHLERRGVPFKKSVPIGTMIEVPSAVAISEHLAKECDFFSIGTNDLIQYSLAVDRGNERIAHMYEPAHPAVLRMIHHAIRSAKSARIPCAICGEMAGDPLFSEVLIGLGISSLSMSAVSIPLVRAEISHIRYSLARRFAMRALKMGTAVDIREAMTRRSEQRKALDEYLQSLDLDEGGTVEAR
ncbi:MAG: phosphoenolpyruvate-protein phosphotransferase [Candidatus Hydrogenedentota bacterium]